MASVTETASSRYVVGIDFGTTFTSVAFTHTSAPDDVKLIMNLRGASTSSPTSDQVPTVVYYTNPRLREKKWGYEVHRIRTDMEGSGTLRWFKLLLQTQMASPVTPIQVHMTAERLQQHGLTPVVVITDFLRSVLELTNANLERTYGRWARETKRLIVMTVPAMWEDYAKAKMIQAAEDAGFGTHRIDFKLISEPESAASYTLKSVEANSLQRGDTFVICDAGGGTVDLISYKIAQLSPLHINESVSGTGGFHGSVYVDAEFEKYIRRVLGDRVIDSMSERSRKEMMRIWEEKVKFRFGNVDYDDDEDGWEVSVQGIPDNDATNVYDNFHTMRNEDVKNIFDPVIDPIIELVKQQVLRVQEKGENVAEILLVGGFGSSEYLLRQLTDTRYGRNSTTIIPVRQPINAYVRCALPLSSVILMKGAYSRTSIVRGALLHGLEGSAVKQRLSRRCYGSQSNGGYRQGKGLGDDTYLDPLTGKWKESDRGVEGHKYWDSKNKKWYVTDVMNCNIKKVGVSPFITRKLLLNIVGYDYE
ncbi:hypothetical protein BDD12DRAFT_757493 [Trichophaea hybrida]|nr:hypothetical protein BDD12DRAFT_757493 [Trichophaea hybrida]